MEKPAPAKVDPRERELRSLQARVAALEKRLDALQAPKAWLPVPESAPAPQAPRLASGALAPATPAQRAARSPGVPSANWLGLAGVLVLALGVVFFLKLAYDRGWVPLVGRYAIGILGGLALWALGDALRKRVHTGFAQALAAGGAAIAYVTLYIGYAAPDYRAHLGLGLGQELALLAVLSVLLAGYAVWRRFEAVAAVAAALSTILLAPAGDFSTAGVLYAAFLDTALLVAAVWRRWIFVAWTALLGANVTIAFGLAEGVHWGIVLGCLLVVNGCALAAAARDRGRASSMLQAAACILLSAVETGFAFEDAGLHRPFAWSFLAFGTLGLVVAVLLRRQGMAAGITGTALVLTWPLLHFDDELARVLAYVALGAVGLGIGLAWRPAAGRLGARLATLAAWAVATLLLVVAGGDGVFDDRRAAALALAGALALGAGLHWALQRRAPQALPLAAVALAESLATVLAALAYTLSGWMITVSWAVVGLAVVVAGLAARVPELRFASFGLFAFVLVRIFTYDIAELSVVGRVLAFLATGALLLLAAFLYARNRRGTAGA